jgi:hypothetical protein
MLGIAICATGLWIVVYFLPRSPNFPPWVRAFAPLLAWLLASSWVVWLVGRSVLFGLLPSPIRTRFTSDDALGYLSICPTRCDDGRSEITPIVPPAGTFWARLPTSSFLDSWLKAHGPLAVTFRTPKAPIWNRIYSVLECTDAWKQEQQQLGKVDGVTISHGVLVGVQGEWAVVRSHGGVQRGLSTIPGHDYVPWNMIIEAAGCLPSTELPDRLLSLWAKYTSSDKGSHLVRTLPGTATNRAQVMEARQDPKTNLWTWADLSVNNSGDRPWLVSLTPFVVKSV